MAKELPTYTRDEALEVLHEIARTVAGWPVEDEATVTIASRRAARGELRAAQAARRPLSRLPPAVSLGERPCPGGIGGGALASTAAVPAPRVIVRRGLVVKARAALAALARDP